VNVALVVAGSILVAAAAVHGAGGEAWVVSRLATSGLPGSRFGGPRFTKAMIRASWHIATIGFLAAGGALLVAGSVVHGDVARGIALAAACASTGFAAVVVGGAVAEGPRSFLRHPAPVLLTAAAVLAWAGVA